MQPRSGGIGLPLPSTFKKFLTRKIRVTRSIDWRRQRGCHVLCEQPLAVDWAEVMEIQRCVAARRIVFMPCHQYRFSPLWRTVSQLVQEDQIGHIHLAQFEVFRLHADPGNEHWMAGWRTDPRIGGGGIIFDIGTHYFYLVLSLFGPPEWISAQIACLSHADYKVEDTALIVLGYANRLVQINLTWAADHHEDRARFVGTNGNIELRGDAIVLQRRESARVANRRRFRQDGISAMVRPALSRVRPQD